MKKISKYLVSIIMPVYNSEKYVGDAIESVIRQTHTNWELLVVDDGSTDKSCDIVNDYAAKDSRIRLLYNDRHVGIPSAPRNYGIDRARGRFVAFLDADDIWLEKKLEQQLPLFFKDNVTAVVFSDYEKINEEGKRAARVVTAPRKTSYSKMLYGDVIGNLTGIYDKSKADKVRFIDINHEDYPFWLAILKSGYIARNTQTVAGLYRVRRGSVTNNKLKILDWQWRIYRDVEKLGLLRSCYYYFFYAMSGLFRYLI